MERKRVRIATHCRSIYIATNLIFAGRFAIAYWDTFRRRPLHQMKRQNFL